MIYLRYLKYIIRHKWFVFLECWKEGLYLHAFLHDLSKLLPCEFFPYAHKFYGKNALINGMFNVEYDFRMAWLHHQRCNKHHWEYWVMGDGKVMPIPEKYIRQILCDWRAMSRAFNNDVKYWFQNNREKMILHPETDTFIQDILFRK